jgi:hypothetical protein
MIVDEPKLNKEGIKRLDPDTDQFFLLYLLKKPMLIKSSEYQNICLTSILSDNHQRKNIIHVILQENVII